MDLTRSVHGLRLSRAHGRTAGRIDMIRLAILRYLAPLSRAGLTYDPAMCRNIRPLFNYHPPTTEAEVRDAALQFVRKISGTHKPSRANQAAFEKAVDEVTECCQRMLAGLVTSAPPRDRQAEVERAREKSRQRFA